MKLLSLNFVTCARKACKTTIAGYPLHIRDAELEIIEMDYNHLFIRSMLPRVDWDALKVHCNELGLPALPESPPGDKELYDTPTDTGIPPEEWVATKLTEDLHNLLLQISIQSGKLVCGNCDHEYAVKEGIANFLLPSHLV